MKPDSSLLKFRNEFFLFLLPIFFVLHEYSYNFPVIPVSTALLLLAKYLLLTMGLLLLSLLLFRNYRKTSLYAFLLTVVYFFFGTVHDSLKKTASDLFLVKYSVLLPLIVLALTVVAIFLKKTARSFSTAVKYLNFLFIILIVVDIITLVSKTDDKQISAGDLSNQLKSCDTCRKPDIYLIITDEYAGTQELLDIFSFDNSEFENQLRTRGFHLVQNSISNYNATAFSMASMLNMDYLKNMQRTKINLHDVFTCRQLIRNNVVTEFFRNSGYEIYNFTFFDVDDKKQAVENFYFPDASTLVTSQTLISHVRRDLWFNFASKQRLEQVKKNDLYNDRKLFGLTKQIASVKKSRPKFIYTHFTMPHHPYFVDSNGKEVAYEVLTHAYNSDKKAYVEYLLYTNKKLLELIDDIKAASGTPPIIILISDHGWRQFTEPTDRQYYFMTLNAVFFPDGDYSQFYDGISNVNQFRAILNSQFGQKLPLLKDSTTFLVE